MSNQTTNNVPFTFHDVTACFSTEEWKVLREWQNELYTNVMKEINRAVISLEPMIATYVFSLRPKEIQDHLQVDYPSSPQGNNNHHSPSPTVSNVGLFNIVREDSQKLHEPLKRNRQECNDNLSTGHTIAIPVMSTNIKNEEDAYLIAHLDLNPKEMQHFNCPTGHDTFCTVMTASIKEEAKNDHTAHEGHKEMENNHCPKGHTIAMPVMSTSIKNEEDAYPIAHLVLNPKEMQRFDCSTGALASTSAHSQNLIHNSEVHLQKLEEDKSENTGCQANIPMLASIKEEQETCLTYNQDPKERPHMIYPASNKPVTAIHVKETHACSSCKKNFTRKSTLKRHQNIHTREKIDTGGEPFQCTACEANFMKKTNLLHHMKTHKGMCASKCTDGGKIDLLLHPRVRTGPKPFACTECKKGFAKKIDLQRHQRIHTGARLFNARNVKKALFKRHIL